MRWMGLVGLLVSGSMLMIGCPALDIVAIPDKALESAIRAELGLPFGLLMDGELKRLKELDARSLAIRDLTGLEHCTNLTWLNIEGNAVSDITPLTPLGSLTYLNIESNDITDLWPLAGLFSLTDLLLSDNEVWDLAPLVANAENGGIGYGTVVTLSEGTLVDAQGEMSPATTDQIARLTAEGVTVVLTTTTNKSSANE